MAFNFLLTVAIGSYVV